MIIKNFIIIFLTYFLIIFSSIGYGKLLTKLFLYKKTNEGYLGLFGLFFLIIYSYISNFFYPHYIVHNIVLLVVGIILYFIFKNRNNDFVLTFIIFSILFIALIIIKTHDDFPYYHFPYTYYLTQDKLMFGIGNFNHGFRTPSSIFYLNSLYYLPYINFFFFHMGSILIMGFVNIILLKKLYNFKFEKINFIFFFILLSLFFINVFFYRIGEHGTDRSAQILVFLFIIELSLLLNFRKFDQTLFTKILLLSALIISLKAFYILYLSYFIIVFLFFLKFSNFKKIILFLKNLKFFYFFILLFSLVIFTNFANTGCLLYPVKFSCLDTGWSIPINEVVEMNNWYEQWSKGGATPNFRVDNPEVYIQKFNWLSNWIEVYFFNKVSDFLLSLILLCIIFLILFYNNKKNKIVIKKEFLYLYLLSIILFFEWLYNHPALRYGGYVLISLLIFLPISFLLDCFIQNKIKTYSKIKFLLIFCLIIFLGRNFDRINNEVEKYQFQPFLDNNFRISDNHFRIKNSMDKIINNYQSCKNKNGTCDKNLSPKVYEINNRYYFSRK